jgi:hypothetical protein
MSVQPFETNWLSPNGFSWDFILEIFCGKSVEKIQISVRCDMCSGYSKLIRLWEHVAELFLEWENFQTTFVEKMKTHILCAVLFSGKSCVVWDNVENGGWTTHATGDNDDEEKMNLHAGFVCLWCKSHQWARASSFTKFLDHTQRRTTVGRTPLG